MKVIIALTNPKNYYNLGAAVRACACWGAEKLIWSGDRLVHPNEWNDLDGRLPRELRMKVFSSVELEHTNRFKDVIGYVPIAVEIREEAENLFEFIHPENAMYIFGPEDGSLNRTILQHCHKFVRIPTTYCLNLSAAVNIILAHRAQQMYKNGNE